jgi:hypothetical protein
MPLEVSEDRRFVLPARPQVIYCKLLCALLRSALFLLLATLGCSLIQAQSQRPIGNTFLLASDIHFNAMADAGLVGDLVAAPPDQWERILARSKNAAFSQYGEDTNWWLLQSSLNAMRVTLPHPALIMVTGDLLAHDYLSKFRTITHDSDLEHYRKFVLKTVQFLALELRKRFPNTRMFLTPGNNDDDCGDYTIEAGGAFLQDTADLMAKLAGGSDEFRRSWEDLGSYDIANPALSGVHILSLNTIFFSANYHAAKFSQGCATVPSTAAADLYAWLESRLAAAQQRREKLWLMFHIPPGIDGFSTIEKSMGSSTTTAGSSAENCESRIVPMWAPRWTAQFDALVEKYHDIIVASFAGHTHMDDFRVIGLPAVPPSFVLIDPAVSPIYDQNPSFRVVSFAKDGSLLDQSTYYLANLLFASRDTRGEWKKEYTFSREWKTKALDGTALATAYQQIVNNQQDRYLWMKLYSVSSQNAHLPQSSIPGLYCAIEGLSLENYGKCYCATADHAEPGSKP